MGSLSSEEYIIPPGELKLCLPTNFREIQVPIAESLFGDWLKT